MLVLAPALRKLILLVISPLQGCGARVGELQSLRPIAITAPDAVPTVVAVRLTACRCVGLCVVR
jgi:hypothetical protein